MNITRRVQHCPFAIRSPWECCSDPSRQTHDVWVAYGHHKMSMVPARQQHSEFAVAVNAEDEGKKSGNI